MNELIIRFKRVVSQSLIVFVLGCVTFLPEARAVDPAAPDTALANGNTADGQNALSGLTTGIYNSAFGFDSLLSNGAAKFNTGIGAATLIANTGDENTATGAGTLLINTTGTRNTADGSGVLADNVSGDDNTGTGNQALASNTGSGNTATGSHALFNNTGDANTAVGFNALASNTTVGGLGANTAVGANALGANTIGADNVGVGLFALANNSTGNANTVLGAGAGAQITGNNNIDIGQAVAGVMGESNTTRIGNSGVTATYISGIFGQSVFQGTGVLVDSTGHIGTVTSSSRFKKEVKPMDKTSEAILALKPVTFHYKNDTKGTLQFGLIAEEVAKVNPDLIIRDGDGKPYTVRYEAVNAMLLNEFLKEHKKVEAQQTKIESQQAAISELKSTLAQERKGLQDLAAQLRKQSAQIQKVSAQMEMSRPAAKVVLGNP